MHKIQPDSLLLEAESTCPPFRSKRHWVARDLLHKDHVE